MKPTSCPTRDDLSAFVLGKLPDEALRRIADHSSNCLGCQKLLQALDVAADPLVLQLRRKPVAIHAPELPALLHKAAAHGAKSFAAAPRLDLTQASAATTPPEATLPPREEEATQALTAILAAPQGPGEIGRLGTYRVLKVLGQGGMGVVFQAEDPKLKRPVALKAMLPEIARKASAKERFLREARATAAIEHDHIVTIYQVDEDRGVPFLAMQMLKGMSLEDFLKKQKAANKALSWGQILKLGREIAKGLAAAHERGLIHRDIKPANVWLDASAGGRVKILDFGLARGAEDAQLTQSGMIIGTAAYMAPEQAKGQHVDARADLYSLGCVLYRLCTGRTPHLGPDAMAVLIAAATEEPMPVQQVNKEVPLDLAALVMKLLTKKPDDRPKSAKAVVEAIQAFERAAAEKRPVADTVQVATPGEANHWRQLSEPGATAPVVAVTQPTRTRARRWPLVAVAATVLLAGSVLLWQVIIHLKTKDGEAKLNVPQGATVTIDKGGKATVEVGQQAEKAPGEIRRIGEGRGHWLCRVGFAADGKSALVTGGGVHRFDLGTGKELFHVLERGGGRAGFALSADGRYFLTGHEKDNLLRLCEADTGKEVRTFSGHTSGLYAAALSADGSRAVSGGSDGTIRLWDVARGEEIRRLAPNTEQVFTLTFSLDGRRVLSGHFGGDSTFAIHLWDADTGKRARSFTGHTKKVEALAFLPDARSFVSCSVDGTVRFWDIETGKERWRKTIGDDVRFVAVSQDGRQALAAGNREETRTATLHLWELPSGRELHRFERLPNHVNGVAFSRDGRFAATCDTWNTLIYWRLPNPAGQGTIGPVTDQWIEQVKKLPAEEQVKVVAAKLKELNPGFDGKVEHKVMNGAVTELTFHTRHVSNIAPVRALASLQRLACHWPFAAEGQVTDLTPVQGLPLRQLDISGNHKVSTLAALRGLPLQELTFSTMPVNDLSPLQGMPLTRLTFYYTQVRDLAPLKGAPLEVLDCMENPIDDLTPLKGMPLKRLDMHATKVRSLAPLAGMPLRELICWNTPVDDLAPLVGLRLTVLRCGYTGVHDLSPLKDMPLSVLGCNKAKVTDLTPLGQLPLKELSCDFELKRDGAILGAIKTLEKINGQSAAEFWTQNPPK